MRIRHASDGEQHVAANSFFRPIRAIGGDSDLIAASLERGASRLKPGLDAFILQNFKNGLGNVLVLARDQSVAAMDDGDLAAETAIDLREFQTDIAAADYDQVVRQEVDLHDG